MDIKTLLKALLFALLLATAGAAQPLSLPELEGGWEYCGTDPDMVGTLEFKGDQVVEQGTDDGTGFLAEFQLLEIENGRRQFRAQARHVRGLYEVCSGDIVFVTYSLEEELLKVRFWLDGYPPNANGKEALDTWTFRRSDPTLSEKGAPTS